MKAASFVNTTGAYALKFNTAQVSTAGHTFAAAASVQATIPTDKTGQVLQPLSANGSQSGSIYPGTSDYYSFLAPVTGQMTVTEAASAGSTLVPQVAAYNANQTLIWQNQNYNGTPATASISP